jgi:hypothetical protein
MQQNKSIGIIICYYRSFPWYFSYFLHSCRYNKNVDFFIISDNQLSNTYLPSNVFVVQKSIEEIKETAETKLGFKVALNHPYKLCDFKPAYGFLFHEIIKCYDFWGCADLDVIFGCIRNFITDELLSNYDTICVRHDVITGYFMLFKNCKKNNELFKQSKDYRKVLSSEKHFCFDETNFAFDQFKDGIPYNEVKSEIESMMHVVKKLEVRKEIKAYFDFHVIEGRPGRLKWDNGILTYKNEYEAILYHLIKLKEVYKPKIHPRKIPDTFYISPTRIYS